MNLLSRQFPRNAQSRTLCVLSRCCDALSGTYVGTISLQCAIPHTSCAFSLLSQLRLLIRGENCLVLHSQKERSHSSKLDETFLFVSATAVLF